MALLKNENNDTRVARNSNKRPRASIACFRCHRKKVRCDATQPECSRCKSSGIMCSYPPSRRSRTAQPTNISPYINNITLLESRIRDIESDLERQKKMVQAMLLSEDTSNTMMTNQLEQTQDEVNDSKSILAQLRLLGEQEQVSNKRVHKNNNKQKQKQKQKQKESCNNTEKFNDMMVQQSRMMYDSMMPWNPFEGQMFDVPDAAMAGLYIKDTVEEGDMMLLNSMSQLSTRSSSLGSQSDFDFTLQPSYSTTSNASSSSSSSSSSTTFTDSYDQVFDYPMLLQPEQDTSFLSNSNDWDYI